MPKDYYPDMDEMPMKKEGMESESKMTPTSDRAESKTVLIPKSILAGAAFEPGDTITLRIVHDYEDEYGAEYAKSESEEESDELPGREEFDAIEEGA